MNNLYFTKPLAMRLCNDFSHLINQLIPNQLEPTYIEDVILIEINNDEYDVILVSNKESLTVSNGTKNELPNLIAIRLLDYLEAENIDFNYSGYGMGYAQITSEKDINGIDLYL